MVPPPPPPPPPAGGYSGGSYYSQNAGSSSSTAARQRLGLRNSQSQQQQAAASSSSDDWFASPAPAPAAAPAPASGSGFYSMGVGGSNENTYIGYGASSSAYGGSNASGGGYYGSSSVGYGGAAGGYGNSTIATSGGIGRGGSSASAPPASAFGSNPNSGSSAQMSAGLGGGSYEMDGGGGSFEMSGAMGGPIGGAPPATPAPHVFDPAAAAAKKAEEKSNQNAMSSVEEDYDNEPPLLEELGVNFPHIYSKSRAVLFPIGKHARSLESGFIENDADLAGPLAFALGLGGELLLAGKLHFGYVYGFGVSGCLAMTLLLNLLNPNGAVSMWTVVSILGYALLPVNLLAGINAFVRVHKLGRWGMVLAVATVAWCTAASARLFERGCNMREQRFLVAYPTALLYTAFVMMTIF